ncbi:hppA [Symbiodinium natans]|uniref:H(+)-exporting diphosphatase n=1 Tax=Symbiodinium natans TaxID=878477 RepID=A0A812TSI4_9DINO|nr:hppA [Symbiodinium natans]
MREINQVFAYRLPQTALFYSLAGASLGLFTVSYFTSFMLLEDQGPKRVVDIGFLISKGVNVYMGRTIPIILALLFLGGWYVMGTAGPRAVACFAVGAALNLLSAQVGVSVTVQGQTRLAHALGLELFDALQIGIRTGSIGGLLATSLALGGMAGMWLLIQDTLSLSGFGSGASIVSFSMRVGGGIFSKGADIGADLVSDMEQNRMEEDQRLFELQKKMAELEEDRKQRAKQGLEGDDEDMMADLRRMEEEMQDIASQLHPIDYFDVVGEAINDVSGTCADLFESMVLILGTCTIIGVKGSPVPSFNSGLPFWIIASGKVGCSLVAYFVHVHERFTAQRMRWSLRANLLLVIGLVQLVQILVSFQEYLVGTISFDRFWHFCIISLMGQVIPEVCVLLGEYFTSTDYSPVRSLAMNADLGIVQVVLQGFGQGFFSTGLPAVVIITCVVATWRLEQHYGLALLSASSVSGTGFQGGIASFGAIATNAHKIIHLTTYHAMSRHRANICAALGDTTAHAGNTISAVNAFSAVFNIALTLLAQTYTELDINYMNVTGSILSSFSQAGLVLGVVMTFAFAANTMISCLSTAQAFAKYVTQHDIGKISQLPFPQSHVRPLKKLASFGTITSMRMTISPIINSLACPMIGGFFLGVKGLLFMLSGSNVLVLCLSIFLINSGQSWVAARKFVLFGLLRDKDGNVIGPDSPHYANLGIGETIGGPFEDTTGPAMNNFIKFVAVFAFVTGGPGRLYDELPDNTWPYGFASVVGSVSLVFFSRVGLDLLLRGVGSVLRSRRKMQAYEEGEGLPQEDDDDDDFDADFHGACIPVKGGSYVFNLKVSAVHENIRLRLKNAREIAKQRSAGIGSNLEQSALQVRIDVVDGSIDPSLVTPDLMSQVYLSCYVPTQLKHGNVDLCDDEYSCDLSEKFFRLLGERLPHRMLLVLARNTKKGDEVMGGSMCFIKDGHIFGRYWGFSNPEKAPFLHFECCYYAVTPSGVRPRFSGGGALSLQGASAFCVVELLAHGIFAHSTLAQAQRHSAYTPRSFGRGNSATSPLVVIRRSWQKPTACDFLSRHPASLCLRQRLTCFAVHMGLLVSACLGCKLFRGIFCKEAYQGQDDYGTLPTFEHSKLVEVSILHGTSTLQDKYDIVKQIGTGTQGKTFLVRQKKDPKDTSACPFYVVKETHDKNPDARAELEQEFERMKCLIHPNITKVAELVKGQVPEDGTWKDCLYVVYEHAVGGDLFNYMQRMIRSDQANSITEAWVAQVFRHVVLGVSYLHSEGIVHNDLKPENLLCMQAFDPQQPGQVPWITITDFGCAKVKGERDFCSGDPRYQSPETFKALLASLRGKTTLGLAGEIGYPADIWSLGVTLFELLSGGIIPFLYEAVRLEDVTNYPDQWEKLKKGVLEEELQVQPHLEGISEFARELLMNMLNKEPSCRPTASQMLKDQWFVTTPSYSRGISKQALSMLEFKKSKGMAHMILLNALATKLQRDHYAESWKVFQNVDSDHNGSISVEEFRAACAQLDMSQWCPCSQASRMGGRRTSVSTIADTLFNIADVDNDGSLNFPEFVAVTFDWSSLDKQALHQTLKRLFDQMDRNNDQQVSYDELANIFHGALSAEEVKQAFSRIDRHENNYLTFEELDTFLFSALSAEDMEKYCSPECIIPVSSSRRSLLHPSWYIPPSRQDKESAQAAASYLARSLGACMVWMCYGMGL